MKQTIQPLPDGRGSEGLTEPRLSGRRPEVVARLFHDAYLTLLT